MLLHLEVTIIVHHICMNWEFPVHYNLYSITSVLSHQLGETGRWVQDGEERYRSPYEWKGVGFYLFVCDGVEL